MKFKIDISREAGFAPSAINHYLRVMTDKPKRPKDANQLARMIVGIATGDIDDSPVKKADAQRRGGLKGGKARAESLSAEDRKAIAQKAAQARWNKD